MINRRLRIRLLIAVVVMPGLVGCAKTVPLTREARETIRSVSINETVKVPDDIMYSGPEGSAAFLLGPLVGGLVKEAAGKGTKAAFKSAVQQMGLPQMVRQDFAAALADAGVFPAIVPERGDAEVKLEITNYGFMQPHGFSAKVKPLLRVVGTLVRPDGSVLWQASDLFWGGPLHTPEEFLGNPELIREALAVASKDVAGNLIKRIRGD